MAARHSAKSKVSAKAPKKTVKPAAKKSAAGTTHASSKKTAASKKPVGTTHASSKKAAATKKPVVKKPAPKTAAGKKAAAGTTHASSGTAAPPMGIKGIGGAKSARIAQIVAESFLSKPQAASAPTSQSAPDETVRVAHRIATELFAKKAEDVVLMDLRNLSTVADYYLIATCRNEPQMRALLGGVQRALSREGVRSLRSEYMPGVRWAVVDFGDIILHLFEKQTRGFYSLERLWADAPSTTLRAEDYVTADAEGDDGKTAGSHDDL
jgi:ribosome-associated protein